MYKIQSFFHTIGEVINMASYIAPAVKGKFDTLSKGLQEMILEKNMRINTLQDLINVLGIIVKENE